MTDYESLRPWASPRQAQILDALKQAGTHRKAAKLLGCASSQVDRAVQRLKRNAALKGWNPELGLTRPDPGPLSIYRLTQQIGPNGEVERSWPKYDRDAEDLKAALEDFAEGLSERVKPAKPVKCPTPKDQDMMSAYVVGDAHIGAYAWAQETGAEDFDTNIATNDLRGAFNFLVDASPPSDVGMLVNVGDFLHANDSTSQTKESKHLLDTDGRFTKVMDRAVDVFGHAIERMLRKHRQVWIVNARGNHDPDASPWLNKVVEAYWRQEPRVTVLSNASKFIYVEWGKVLIGVHHGDRVKRQQLYEAMTRDKRESWGRAKFSYFWTGHIHHKEAEEIGGCLFESFNTLAAPDAWHAGMGYGANREMQQITLHKDFGIVARNVCGLEMARLAA